MTEPTPGFTLDDLEDYNPAYEESENSSPTDGPPRLVVWHSLSSDEAEYEWLRLNEWIEDGSTHVWFHIYSIPNTGTMYAGARALFLRRT